jgi:hypothetical protein
MIDDRSADGLRYNRKGYLIPPQSEGVWAAITGIYAMVIPLIVTKTTMRSPIPSVILHKLAVFQLAIAHNLLSVDEVAQVEFLFAILLIARICGFPSFFRKYAFKYAEQSPPPDPLRRLWPTQIRGRFYIAAVFLGGPILLGAVMQAGLYQDYMKSPELSLMILTLGLGLWFLMESIYAALLYLYFYLRYWRHFPKASP